MPAALRLLSNVTPPRAIAAPWVAWGLCLMAGAWTPHSAAQTPMVQPAGATHAPNIGRGQALHKALCLRCHAMDQHGIGPAHRGIYNRLAGTQAGYEYSTGLKRSRIRWNAQTLDRWLADPDAFVTWQQMDFKVPDAQDRADLIAYLRTLR